MKVVVQRVSSASVEIEGNIAGSIGRGFLILLGITHTDTEKDVSFLVDKCLNLRVFEDKDKKMNLSLLDVKGEMLLVSQFTLYGDASKGRRPSFTQAAHPVIAVPLYNKFICELRKSGLKVENGVFGADMNVSLCNDGPVTILLESK
ncbi:MAG TPA: D-tyrosyl-tRNA(Tyr) deacylase [Lentisphaeria bacterium]|nr:MAG: D-tyrosyl-tRNA(Tyr) deacylase [Lentisphaerae bacterium GWF2_50_93]HCE45209.1 D-tyrosyl-tRNA(Tyr) deacylase [Lentisphaeria bacterium]